MNNDIKHLLSKALIHARKEEVIELIEKNKLSYNEIINNDQNENILLAAINTLNEFHGSRNQKELVEYLVQNGANPNTKTTDGFNSIHLSLEYHDLSSISLLLIQKGNVDINSIDSNGNNLIFIAIREYGKTWRDEQKKINNIRFKIIEELLERGANLDLLNNHGICSRRWLEISNDKKLQRLIDRFEK